MIVCVVQVVDSVGQFNTVTFTTAFDNDANMVYARLVAACDGLTVQLATVVGHVNGKLLSYSMRMQSDGTLKIFNRSPMIA